MNSFKTLLNVLSIGLLSLATPCMKILAGPIGLGNPLEVQQTRKVEETVTAKTANP